MAVGIWGQTRNSGDWTLDPMDLSKRRWAVQAGRAPRYGDRHDVRYTDQERSTSNVQLATFNGVPKGRMMVGIWGQTRNLDNLTLDPVGLTKSRPDGLSRPRHPDMGTDTMSDIPVRNVQRETFNSQHSTG